MEDLNKPQSIPLFKKIDKAVFERIDKFRVTPGYTNVQDFYNGLDEEQQKVFRAGIVALIFIIPALMLGFFSWQNNSLQSDLESRLALTSKANEIIGQRQSLRTLTPSVLSDGPIDGESMMTSRLANMLSSSGFDLSKVKITNYNGTMTSGTIMQSEADFQFSNLSTDELMNLFTTMIRREKFRIQSVDITRNSNSNLLQGQFHAIHLGSAENLEDE